MMTRAWNRYFQPLLLALSASAMVPAPLRPAILRCLGITVGRGCHLSAGSHIRGRQLTLGDHVVLGTMLYVDATAPTRIDERCHIGPGTTIMSATHTIQPDVFRRAPDEIRLLGASIGRGCWLGANVTVLAGVEIGEGCVIGAGAVVTASCPPNGLYVGTPARRVKDLPVAGSVAAADGAART